MAYTISVDLANKENILDNSTANQIPNSKKTVSAKALQDTLGGNVDGLGYLKTTGDTISGRLVLTAFSPEQPFHISTKSYVDSHTPLRKYIYVCKTTTSSQGEVNAGSDLLSGADIFNNHLYFFERNDSSLDSINQYIDVYRDGVLQSIGTDYSIINNFGGSGIVGITAVRFFEPFENGSTFQVNIGNVSSYPLTFGVRSLSGTLGNRFFKRDGYTRAKTLSSFYVSYLNVRDIASTSNDVATTTSVDVYVSPATLSAFPLMPRATGLFRKQSGYNPEYPPNKYGNASGNFTPITTNKILSVISDPYNSNQSQLMKVILAPGIVESRDYNCNVIIRNSTFDPDFVAFNHINSSTKTLSSFEFIVYDYFNAPPQDVYEISILVF